MSSRYPSSSEEDFPLYDPTGFQGDRPNMPLSFPRTLLGASADEIKDYIRGLHDSEAKIYSTDLDILLLGTMATQAETELWKSTITHDAYESLHLAYPNEKPWNGSHEGIWTPYSIAKDMVHSVTLSEDDTFYDLGAGYGRMVLYTAITAAAKSKGSTPDNLTRRPFEPLERLGVAVAQYKGIEMVSERAQLVQAAISRLELPNAELIEGKVQDVDYSDGDVFYMYSPFSAETFDNVFDHLEAIATNKPITVINKGQDILRAKARGRLQELALVREIETSNLSPLHVFETADIANSPYSRVAGSGPQEM